MPVTWSRTEEWNDVNGSGMSDSSYSLNLFSRPLFGVLITATVKPNVSSIIGPRFGRGVGN